MCRVAKNASTIHLSLLGTKVTKLVVELSSKMNRIPYIYPIILLKGVNTNIIFELENN